MGFWVLFRCVGACGRGEGCLGLICFVDLYCVVLLTQIISLDRKFHLNSLPWLRFQITSLKTLIRRITLYFRQQRNSLLRLLHHLPLNLRSKLLLKLLYVRKWLLLVLMLYEDRRIGVLRGRLESWVIWVLSLAAHFWGGFGLIVLEIGGCNFILRSWWGFQVGWRPGLTWLIFWLNLRLFFRLPLNFGYWAHFEHCFYLELQTVVRHVPLRLLVC